MKHWQVSAAPQYLYLITIFKNIFQFRLLRISDNTILSSQKKVNSATSFSSCSIQVENGKWSYHTGMEKSRAGISRKKKKQKNPKDLVLMSFDMSHSQPDSFPSAPSTVQCPQCLFGFGFHVLPNSFNSGIYLHVQILNNNFRSHFKISTSLKCLYRNIISSTYSFLKKLYTLKQASHSKNVIYLQV